MKSEMPQYNHSISPSLNLINALIHLKEQGPWAPRNGICTNIHMFLEQAEFLERRLPTIEFKASVKAWPKAVGDEEDYPVGGADEYIAEKRIATVWQNPRRLELLDFIIDYLNK